LRDVIARHGLMADKRLGQNFLLDLNLTARIAREAAPFQGFSIYEVGPGPGGLTRALLAEGAEQIVAVERDRRCLAALEELGQRYPDRLRIVSGDALSIDETAIVPAPRKLVANLPYNIATPLLLKWLRRPEQFQSYTLLFQKEVAERLAAQPGGKAYGRLSVIVQWVCEVKLAFDINPRAFTPAPKVTSTVVHLTPRPAPLAPAPREALERLTQAAFGQRRKMLRTSLKAVYPNPEELLAAAGIDATRRGETLSVEEFCRLARMIPG
jgi:16S rRNA (adenine1518-N6/adenine1519-N6)-dimethyltransferase